MVSVLCDASFFDGSFEHLIGETLMREAEPEARLRSLLSAARPN